MSKFYNQAIRNEEFHNSLVEKFNKKYFDWRITTLFYSAIHYLKNLAESRKIDIGQTHIEIEKNVNPEKPNPKMSITKNAWREYKSLLNYSRTSRYEGINTDIDTFEEIMNVDYKNCLIHFEKFKKYIENQKPNTK